MLRYFVDERERKASHSSCYFEFQKGHYHDRCWLRDSISIRDTLWDRFNLSALFAGVVGAFDDYGITAVTKSQWDEIVKISRESDPVWREIVLEAVPWAEECFAEHEVFTIVGI